MRAVAGVAASVLLLQLVITVVALVQIDKRNNAAAEEAFNFVGSATVESVGRYLDDASQAVESLAVDVAGSDLDIYDGSLQFALYQHLRSQDYLSALYVGFDNGDFAILRRDPDSRGYKLRQIVSEPIRVVSDEYYDISFVYLSNEILVDGYDPRARPWYALATGSVGAAWTDPYVFHESQRPGVTVTIASRTFFGAPAVAGADLQLDELGEILDDLPLGEDGEAFLLSSDRTVVAAPSRYANRIVNYAKDVGSTIPAEKLGILTSAPLTGSSELRAFGTDGDHVTLETRIPNDNGADWILHIRATASGIAPELEAAQSTILWLTVPNVVLLFIAAGLFAIMLRPIRDMRTRAETDSLTGLSNRHEFFTEGQRTVASAQADGRALAVVTLDLDNFKAVNDRFGHGVGDEALRTVGRAIAEVVRTRDVAGRLGGDEFAIVLNLDKGSNVRKIVDGIRTRVSTRITSVFPAAIRPGVTAGFAVLNKEQASLERVLRAADEAMIEGKRVSKGATYPARRKTT